MERVDSSGGAAPLRLGMLGAWHTHAAGLVRQIVAHPAEFRLVAVWDPDPSVVARRRSEWSPTVPGLRFRDRAEEVLAEPLDGIVVEGRVHENVDWARRGLEAGFPVLLEKPAGTSLTAFRELVALARERRLHLQMLYLFRYLSTVVELRERIRRGEVGGIYAFRARMPKELHTYERFVDELSDYPGGIFFEMAGHLIDIMVELLGRPKSVRGFLAHHHRAGPPSYVDNGLAVFEFEHAWGTVEVPAMEVAPESRRLEVYGTEGAITIPHCGSGHLANAPLQPLEVFRAGESAWQRLELTAAVLQISDLREFAACVRGRKRPSWDATHDLAVQEALLTACGML